jgi:hypothetical protein
MAFAVHAAQMKVVKLYMDVLGDKPDQNTTIILAKVVRAMVEDEEKENHA